MSKNEEIIKVEDFPFYRKVWLLTELARTENPLAIQTKYKRIFGANLSDSIIHETSVVHKQDIIELRKAAKIDLESHELAQAYKRMDKYAAIEEMCMEGYETGTFDMLGNNSIKKDPATALKAVIAGRDEQNQVYQNELKLLQIMSQYQKLNGPTLTASDMSGTAEVIDAEPTSKKIETDSAKFFEF